MNQEFRVRDRRIVDRHGRVRIFHGANVSGRAKYPPFLQLENFDDLETLERWGWNLVRLVTVWEAIEPEPRRYDDAYIDTLLQLARACHERGLHTIIDLHQDLYSRHYGGDGAPHWALPGEPGGAIFAGSRWFLNYFLCRDLIRAEQRFWRNASGIRERYLEMLTHLAARFSEVPGVLGYDVMNEPMGHPAEVFSGRFERKTLAPFYRAAIEALRKGDPDGLVFIEPSPLVGRGYPCFLPAFKESNLVFAPHFYDSLAMATMRIGSPLAIAPYVIGRFAGKARRLGTPVLIGEFGILTGDEAGRRLLAAQVEKFDERFFSWAAWHYNPSKIGMHPHDANLVTPDGKERAFMGALVRPYARAVAGRPVQTRWDEAAHRFTFDYIPDSSCTAPTEIVLPRRCFWTGASIVVEGARWKPDTVRQEILYIDPRTDAPVVRVAVSG